MIDSFYYYFSVFAIHVTIYYSSKLICIQFYTILSTLCVFGSYL